MVIVQAIGRVLCLVVVAAGWAPVTGLPLAAAAQASDGLSDVPPASVAYRSVSAGGLHSCAIRADGTLVCWGNNVFGQADPPDGIYTAVTAGEFQSCGLRTDGSVTCWGRNLLFDNFTTPPLDGSYTAVSAGFRTCAVRTDGTVTCWPVIENFCWSVDRESDGGPDHVHVCWDPDESLSRSYNAIAVAGWTECGLGTDGAITCWGLYSDVPPAGIYKAVSAGVDHSCAIRVDDSIVCWGDSVFGQADPPDGRYMAVAAGRSHSCGLRTYGAVTCWGSNMFGQADPRRASTNPSPPETGIVAL